MKTLLWSLFIFSFSQVFSQEPKASRDELCWALFHPCAAMKVKKISRSCRQHYDTAIVHTLLDRFSNGGKEDAFRHVYYMAAFAQKISAKKLRKLGVAHEKNNYRQFLKHRSEFGERADSMAMVMDLYNNDVGIEMGRSNEHLNPSQLHALAVSEIKKGKALIMKRNRKGIYITCDGELIDMKTYQSTWGVPKCLVKSNYVYGD